MPCYANIAYPVAVAVGSHRADADALSAYSAVVQAYAEQARSCVNVIRPHARMLNCANIAAVYVGDSALVESAGRCELVGNQVKG